jgi:hypothetical protein
LRWCCIAQPGGPVHLSINQVQAMASGREDSDCAREEAMVAEPGWCEWCKAVVRVLP